MLKLEDMDISLKHKIRSSFVPKRVQETLEEAGGDYQSEIKSYQLEPIEGQIVSSVNSTHYQLGGLVLWNLLIIQAKNLTEHGNLANACLTIAPTGIGKSTANRAIAFNVKGIRFIRVDGGFTPAKVERDGLAPLLNDAVIYADDLETFLSNSTTLISLCMLSQLCEAGCWLGGNIASPTIEKADVAFLACGTPNSLQNIVSLGLWKSHIKERFVRLYWCYYNFPYDEKGLPITRPFLPRFEYTYKKWNLSDIKWSVSPEWEKKVIRMFESQFTENRAANWARRLMIAHAVLNDRDYVDNRDARFLLLYKPFIEIEKLWIFKPKVVAFGVPQSGPLQYCDIYPEILQHICMRPLTMDELRIKTNYGMKTLAYSLDVLMDKFVELKNNVLYPTGPWAKDIESFHKIMEGN